MVILLIGPAGSGKTSLGRRIAEVDGWVHICEDDVWSEIGHPPHELRTPGGQALVHTKVGERIRRAYDDGLNVLLEFLVYENPPIRITHYQDFLSAQAIPFETRVIRPSLEKILERQSIRGRPSDRDTEARRQNLEHQLSCLRTDLIEPEWVIDTSDETLEESYVRHFADLVEPK